MYRLVNRIRDYAWGSTTAIPDLLGLPADGRPQAELWIGAHSAAPSLAIDEAGHARPLDEVIREDPIGLLGEASVHEFGPRLPFLLKVLAASRALSLQVHPDAARAARRFAEQEHAGIPVDATHRTYSDPYAKPELIYALTSFDALCGFRPAANAAGMIRELLDRGAYHPTLDGVLTDLDDADEGIALRAATRRLLTIAPPCIETLVETVAQAGSGSLDPAIRTAALLARQYPVDAGVVVSLLLNTVRLEPGQAMFLPAGNVHAYLHGTGIELMGNSDNVLRGGLTDKHIDVAEFLDVVDFRALPVPLITPHVVAPHSADSGERVFRPPAPEFQLSVTQLAADRPVDWADKRPREVLVLEGTALLHAAGRTHSISRGQSVFVPARDNPSTASGDATMVVATTGRHASATP